MRPGKLDLLHNIDLLRTNKDVHNEWDRVERQEDPLLHGVDTIVQKPKFQDGDWYFLVHFTDDRRMS